MTVLARRCHALAAVAVLASVALAQPQDEEARTPAQMLEEFIHYTLIAKPELAAGWAQKLLQTTGSDAELAEVLSEDSKLNERFERALAWAQRVPDLEVIAGELDRRIAEGRLALARDQERIERAIGMLTGNLRMKLHAGQQLAAAGEYAIPKLLRTVVETKDDRLRIACGDMMVEIGRTGVTPLCTALPGLDDRNQRFVCNVLGEIKLPHAAPYLKELAGDEKAAAATRDAALRAFRGVGGVDASLGDLYTALGRQYFNEAESLIAYPYEATNNVWSYDAMAGLEATAVPTAIYSEVMAMRTAAKALALDASSEGALSLFVASNLRRENELPSGADDPIYGENRYSPAFYATVFGTRVCQDVLAMGIDRLDSPLVRDAIAALSQTTGGANLFSATGGRQPLIEALQYPDRRVQYESALTLARALPEQRFSGDVAIVPLLASAVRSAGKSFAAVVAADEEDRRIATTRLESLGYTVIAAGPTFDEVRVELAGGPGVDLVVLQAPDAERGTLAVGEVHAHPRSAATPVLVLASAQEMPELRRAFRDDVRVNVARTRIADDEFAAAVSRVLQTGAGGRMTEAEAEAYAIESIMALRDIAISGNTAYTIEDAQGALLLALAERQGSLRLSVADIVALLPSSEAQQALFDAALAAKGEEQVELLDRVAASVKRHGSHAEERQIQGLLDLIANASGTTAEAAARVHGALNLPAGTALRLIP
jgi:hypothetical protein